MLRGLISLYVGIEDDLIKQNDYKKQMMKLITLTYWWTETRKALKSPEKPKARKGPKPESLKIPRLGF